MAVEHAGKHQPRHRDAGLVRPAEAPPHLEARFLLRRIVRHRGGARRMQPDRQVVRGHRGKHRLEALLVERMARDVGEDLDAARAELSDRALGFLQRAIHIVERHRGDEGRKAPRVRGAQLRHRVVGDARELRRGLALRDLLQRRVGQRDHLRVVADLVHLGKAQIEIEQLLHAAQPRADVLQPGRDARHLPEEAIRENVRVDVEDHRPSVLILRPRRIALRRMAASSVSVAMLRDACFARSSA